MKDLDAAVKEKLRQLVNGWSVLPKYDRCGRVDELLAFGISRRDLGKHLKISEGTIRNELKRYHAGHPEYEKPVARDDKAEILRRSAEGREVVYATPLPVETLEGWVKSIAKATKQFIISDLQLQPWVATQVLWLARIRMANWHLQRRFPKGDMFANPEDVFKGTRRARANDEAIPAAVQRLAGGLLQLVPFPNLRNGIIRQLIDDLQDPAATKTH